MQNVLRAPDERFHELPDFQFDPLYIDILKGFDGPRMHYVDDGHQNADNTFLCLHGERIFRIGDRVLFNGEIIMI